MGIVNFFQSQSMSIPSNDALAEGVAVVDDAYLSKISHLKKSLKHKEPENLGQLAQLGLAFDTSDSLETPKNLDNPQNLQPMPLFDAPSAPELLGVMPTLTPLSSLKKRANQLKHSLKLNGITIQYTLKRSNRRSIGFSIGLKGLTVSAPQRASINMIEAALFSKQKWIVTKLRLVHTKVAEQVKKTAQCWEHGAILPYLGKNIVLHLGSGTSFTRLQHGMFDEETLLLALNDTATTLEIHQAVYHWLRQEASKRFAERIAVYEAALNVKSSRWRLSNAKARWGSASSDGVISLHWRLIQLKPDIIDYVVVHELSHLHEMNHSKRFWGWVETACPHYRTLKQLLKNETIDV
jgi:predicted metal-dependent hydrolase